MFKKSRRKIVVAIMSVLVLLWAGTLGVIYGSSFFEVKRQNRQMLQVRAQMYALPPAVEGGSADSRPAPGAGHGFKPRFDPDSPMFRLSNFYTVAMSYSGEILEIVNQPPTIHTDDTLTGLAKSILCGDRASGTVDNLSFYKADKGGYMLVTFMDNTAVNESAMTLFRYTLLFGGVALALFFFLSVFLARKIVAPLEESYQKQARFISDAGHELKTPVAVVSANAELLSREVGDNQWLQNIRYENERMGTLVGQLLDLARTEQVKPKTERLDFSRLVAGEALPFESVAYEKGLTLSSQIAPGIVLEGSGEQLKQLISILLDNGIRHSDLPGTVALTLTAEHGSAVLSVVNRGQEIPQAQRRLIFERFYRLDPVRNSQDGHYGLGLSIAGAIVSAHHGSIQVDCHDGLVEFRVTLPCLRSG